MKKFVVALFVVTVIISCSDKKKKNLLPAPASKSAVQAMVKGKTFITDRIGTVSPFASGIFVKDAKDGDKKDPFNWFDEEKELNDFAKKYETERKAFALQFINDTVVKITDDGKTWDAVYQMGLEGKDEERDGMKLWISYPDKEGVMSLSGATEPMTLSSTYIITGISDNEMVLETPREFNRNTVVVWMKGK